MLEDPDEVLNLMFLQRDEGEEFEVQDTNGPQHNIQFLSDNITYHFPDYMCCMSLRKKILKFTLLVVEDVLSESVTVLADYDDNEVHVKFCAIKLEPREAVHYAFMVKLPGRQDWLDDEAVGYVVLQNRVIFDVPFLPRYDDGEIWFLCGRSMSELKKRTLFDYEMFIEDDSQSSSDESSEGEAADNPDWATSDL